MTSEISASAHRDRIEDVPPSVFPSFTPSYFLAFQFSTWFPSLAHVSLKSTIIRPLDQSFRNYLESDGVYVPEGSEDVPAESTLSDDESDGAGDSEPAPEHVSFPELDAAIRRAIEKYQAVFPKLNFSSPKDAAWVLPLSSPLKCTSPADVYLLLKSSDFITHDLSTERVFEGCRTSEFPSYDLELVLRKWYSIDRSREVRCFVRNDTLLGISQRDTNFYDYMIDPATQSTIQSTVRRFWEENIRPKWTFTHPDYVFDLLLTRDLSRGHVLDFNPYAPRTDPLLFTYGELHALLVKADGGSDPIDHSENGSATVSSELPEIRVIDSPLHPAATRNAPAFQHNMVPIEALSLSEGRDITVFSEIWKDEVQQAMLEDEKS
ncbi:D123-domain-containing protein [Melanogaster broomeanus]|nr:D123-domain-containing protein [Melanogaster broomeanus]